MKGSRLAVLLPVFALLLIGMSTQAFGDAYYNASSSYYERQPNGSMLDKGESYYSDNTTAVNLSLGTSSYPAAVTITNPGSYATMSGYANASTLALGVSGYVKSLGYNASTSTASMSTNAANSFTVLPGASGLSIGDRTTLRLNISLDGSAFTDAPRYPGDGDAFVNMRAGLGIWDPQIFVEIEGKYYPDQAYFGASLDAEAYDLNPAYASGKDFYAERSDYFRIGSNSTTERSGSYYWDSNTNAAAMSGIPIATPGNYQQSLLLDVIVGHTLNVEAYMSTLVQASGTAEAWCDYDNTFKFSLDPSVQGVLLDWDIAVVQQPSSVPEPISLIFLGLGLVGLAGIKKRLGK